MTDVTITVDDMAIFDQALADLGKLVMQTKEQAKEIDRLRSLIPPKPENAMHLVWVVQGVYLKPRIVEEDE